MMRAATIIARMTLLRLARGRSLWVSGLVLLFVPAVAIITRAAGTESWRSALETALHFSVLLVAPIHLAGAVGEEVEVKTHTYLWSRPLPREALLVGKLLAIVPLLAVAGVIALIAAYLAAGGLAAAPVGELLRALVAIVAGSIAAAAVSVGLGALFPRHPLVLAVAYLLAAEHLLWLLPESVKNLSVLWHMTSVASGQEIGFHLGALAVQATLWLGVGVWRVRTAEYAGMEG